MKLLFKQRLLSLLDSYDIYDENGNTVYEVKSELSIGHKMHVLDTYGYCVGTIKQEVLTLLPRFAIYQNDTYVGCIKKEFSLLKPKYDIDYNGWHIEGDFFEWDYEILDRDGQVIATISKQLFNFTDTYVLDVVHDEDALTVLLFVLAIDAEKCSRD